MVAVVNAVHSRQDPGISTYALQQAAGNGRALVVIVNTYNAYGDNTLSFDGSALTSFASHDDLGGTADTKTDAYVLFDNELPASAGTYGLVTENWLYKHVAIFELSGAPQVTTNFVTGFYDGLKPWVGSVSAEVGSLHLMSLFANTISTKNVDNAGSTKVVDPTELSGRGVALYHVVTDGAAEDVGFSQEFGDALGGMFSVTIPVVAETLSFTPTPAKPKPKYGQPWLMFGDELWIAPGKSKARLRAKAPGWQMSLSGFMANVTDPDGDPLSFEITQQPTNADLITGFAGVAIVTPHDDQSASSDFWFRPWSDGKPGLNEYQVQVTYDSFQVAPIFNSSAVLSVNDGVNYSYSIACSDANGDTLTITAPTKPTWATLVDNGDGTASLSGIPTDEAETDYLVVLNVFDGLLNAQQNFTIVVNRPPVITSADSIAADTWSTAQHQLTATGNSPFVYSLVGTPPAGVTIDGSGLVSVDSNAAGNYSLTARVVDNNGLSADQPISLSVNGAPVFFNSNTINAEEQEGISFTVEAQDPEAEVLTLSVVGSLPVGITFTPVAGEQTSANGQVWQGQLIGDIDTAGTYSIQVQAVAANSGGTSVQDIVFTITTPNTAPLFTSANTLTVTQGQSATLAMTATDADGDPLTFSISSNSLAWANQSAGTNNLVFTPGLGVAAGTYQLTVQVTDGIAVVPQVVSVTVLEASQSDTIDPVVTPPQTGNLYFPNGSAGLSHSDADLLAWASTATAIDNIDGNITASITNNLTTLSDPLPAGSYTITFSVADAAGNVGSATAVLNVSEAAAFGRAPINRAVSWDSAKTPNLIVGDSFWHEATLLAGEGVAYNVSSATSIRAAVVSSDHQTLMTVPATLSTGDLVNGVVEVELQPSVTLDIMEHIKQPVVGKIEIEVVIDSKVFTWFGPVKLIPGKIM